ncbi:MAG: Ig-like domain repeat protein, partial [Terracidiphilus sp.]
SAGAGAIVLDGITEGKIGTGTTPEYNAAAGYNLATGLGTIDAANLVNNWASVKFAATATTMTPSSTSFAHGTAITISGAVTGTGTPTGNVALMTDSSEPVQQGQGLAQTLNGFVGTYGTGTFALSSGSYTGSVSTLPGGTYHIWGQYGGDSKNAMSASAPPIEINVTAENSGIFFNAFSPSGTFTAPQSVSTAIDYGTQLDLSAQVAPSSQLSSFSTCTTSCPIFTIPTGTVTFTDSSTNINTAVVNAEGDAEYNAPFAVGAHTVTANYNGDNSYNKSTSPAISFTVAKDSPDLSLYTTLTTSQNDLISGTGQQTILTVEISNDAQSSFASSSTTYPVPVAPPTGTVTLSGSTLSALSGSVALSSFVDPTTAAQSGVANFVVPANTATGTYSVTIAYSGDGNYNSIPASSNTTASIPIDNLNTDSELPSATAATATGSISPNSSITVSGAVTGQSGHLAPTGGVYIFSSGAYLGEVGFSSTSGIASSFAFALSSQDLAQGSNYITLQYSGDTVYNPSTFVLYSNTPLPSPRSDFTLVPDTTIVPVSVSAGAGSGTDTINVSSVNGFNGAVNLTCAATTPLTCTISPNPSVSTGNPSTATLTIKVPAGTANGNYNVLVTGKDAATGEFIHTLAVTAEVSGSGPAETLTNNGPITVVQGATTGNTSTITVTPSGSFTGVVNLTCAVTNAPAGAANPLTCTTADLNPDSVDITGAGALTSVLSAVTTATTTPGSYSITVTGTSGALTSTTVVNVTVNLPADFSMSNNGPISFPAGATSGDTATITVTPSGGFSSTVNLTCAVTTVPSGAANPLTCGASNLNPDSVTPPGTTTSVLTASSTATTTTGAYVITVTGAFGTDTHPTTVNVTVNAPAASTYTVTATSPSGSISPGGSPATSTITVAGSGGYTGSVTLSCSLTSSPTGASDLPGCTITTGSPVALSVGTTSGNATATVTTTAATADLIRLNLGLGKGWLGTGSGAVLAVLLFFGIPARRRSWRKLLCIMVAMAIIGTLSSCGGSNGGGGGGGGTGPTNPGTTAGTYTFTVTGSGNPAVTPAPSSTFTVSVN